jgi:hypothetical protein
MLAFGLEQVARDDPLSPLVQRGFKAQEFIE